MQLPFETRFEPPTRHRLRTAAKLLVASQPPSRVLRESVLGRRRPVSWYRRSAPEHRTGTLDVNSVPAGEIVEEGGATLVGRLAHFRAAR